MESFVTFLVKTASLLALFFLLFPFIATVVSFLGGKRNKAQFEFGNMHKEANETADFGCIITAYRNLNIALPAIDALLKQNYKNYHVYLIADDCDISELAGSSFPDGKVTVLMPSEPFHAKVKSIQYAVENYVQPHTHTVVFDADNLAAPDFLMEMNRYIQQGYRIVQGKRTAKNLDTIYACADATGEIYKNYIERYVPYLLGSSATIAGSGMAVETGLLKEFLYSPEIIQLLKDGRVIVAEDKKLQNFLLNRQQVIAFAAEAVVYDEKVKAAAQVKRQRTRWLYAYFQNIPQAARLTVGGIGGFNRNLVIAGIFSLIPPLFILLFGSVLLALINCGLLDGGWFMVMILGIVFFIGNIFWVLWLNNAPRQIWQALWGLPLFIIYQMLALFHIKQASKNFMHTQHSATVGIDQVGQQQ